METITILGIDLAKNYFQLHGVNFYGKVVLQRKISRNKLVEFMANLPKCLIGMEACGSSHFWAKKFIQFGHEVKLMAPQFVKPYVKSNKNDRADAEAICEAVTRPNMRFVQIKNDESQDLQSLHKLREMQIADRTALINQMRAFLYENGIIIPQGRQKAQKEIPDILADESNELSTLMKEMLQDLYSQLLQLNELIQKYENKLKTIFKTNDRCKRIGKIEGVGVIVATAIIAAIGDPKHFKNGRQFAAWLGLVPRQNSSGGKENLLGISKRGNIYIRKLLIHGTRSVINWCRDKSDKRSLWIKDIEKRRGLNRTSVAIANKNARIIWALLSKNEEYRCAN